MATDRPGDACILMALVDTNDDVAHLKYWDSGRNHILLNTGREALAHYPNAVIVSASFHAGLTFFMHFLNENISFT